MDRGYCNNKLITDEQTQVSSIPKRTTSIMGIILFLIHEDRPAVMVAAV